MWGNPVLLYTFRAAGALKGWWAGDFYRAGFTIALTIRSVDPIRSLDLFTRLMDFGDYLDCLWQVASVESARSLS